MVEIIARKQSSDPIQEKLREDKAEWNPKVSDFIKALIALKKAINGRPVSELSLGKGDIRNPLPDVIPNLLDRLSSEYEKLTQDGKNLVQEQLEYSEHRKKHQENQEVQQEQLADDGINKEASNIFSRLYTYVSTPFRFGDEDRFERKNILKSAVELEKKISEIGVLIVSSGDENAIPKVVYNTKTLMNLFQHNIVRPILDLSKKKSKPKELSDNSAPKPDPKPAPTIEKPLVAPPKEPVSIPDLEEIPNDVYQQIASMEEDIEKNIIPSLTHIQASIGLEEGKLDPTTLVPVQEILSTLRSLIPDFLSSIQKREDPNILYSKYNEIKNKYNIIVLGSGKLKLIEASHDAQIQKFAKGRFKRWLGRQKLSVFKQQDYRLRLNADELITQAIVLLNKLMDKLQENKAPVNEVVAAMIEFSQVMSELLKNIMELGDIHNAGAKINKLQAKTDGVKFKENIISEVDIRSLDKFNKKIDDMKPKSKKQEKSKKQDE